MPFLPGNFPSAYNGFGVPFGPGARRSPNWRGLLLLIVTVLAMSGLYYGLIHPRVSQTEMTQTQLLELIKQGRVTNIVNEPDPSTGIRTLTGTYRKSSHTAPNAPFQVEGSFQVPVDLALSPSIATQIAQAGYKGVIETRNNTNLIWPLFLNFVPLILVGGPLLWLLYFLCFVTWRIYRICAAPHDKIVNFRGQYRVCYWGRSVIGFSDYVNPASQVPQAQPQFRQAARS